MRTNPPEVNISQTDYYYVHVRLRSQVLELPEPVPHESPQSLEVVTEKDYSPVPDNQLGLSSSAESKAPPADVWL